MRTVFVDTLFWVALLNPRDQWHQAAVAASRRYAGYRSVTTDEVLIEFLAAFSEAGPAFRRQATLAVRNLLQDPTTEVIPQTRQSFLDGLALYEARPDKGYCLTDCISMQTMRREGIMEILTHDKHFPQEGFIVLL